VRLGRVRPAEILAAAGGVGLASSLFIFDWYERSVPVSLPGAGPTEAVGVAVQRLSGWEALTILRWLLFAAAVAGVALLALQISQRSTGLPATFSVAVTWLGLLASLLLLYRIVNQPGPNDRVSVEPGAWVGLLTALMVAVGGWWSMRDENPGLGGDEDRPPVPVLRVDALPEPPAADPPPVSSGGSVPPPGA